MSEAPNILFPLVLDILSHKPLLSASQGHLLRDLSQKLKKDGIKVNNLKKALDATVDLGQGLGILTVEDEEVKIPSPQKGSNSFRKKQPSRSKSAPGSSQRKEVPLRLEPGRRPKSKIRESRHEKARIQSRSRVRSRSRSLSYRRRARTRSRSRSSGRRKRAIRVRGR